MLFKYFLEGTSIFDKKQKVHYYKGIVIAEDEKQAREKITELYGGYIDVKANFDTLEIDLIDGRCLWENNVWETHEMK